MDAPETRFDAPSPDAAGEPAAGVATPGPPEALRPPSLSKLEAVAEMALCSSIPTQLAIGWGLRLAGVSPVDESGRLTLGFVAILSFADTLALVGLMVLLLRARGQSPSELWLGRRPIAREILAGVSHVPLVFIIGGVLLLAIRSLTPQLHNVDVNPFETLAGSLPNALLLTLVAILAGGVREELQRAFLLDRFVRYLGPAWLGVLLLSVAFGLGHLMQGRDAAVATGAMGAFWAVIYLRRRSSVAPVVSHALFNTIEVLQIAGMTR